jgi:hypothetical protein
VLYQTEPRPDKRERLFYLSLAKLEAIWIKRAKQGPMDAVEDARLDAGRGIRGNANRGGRRQVTIISAERWQAICAALGAGIPPSTRRANLLVSGLELENTRGRILRVGATRLRINGEPPLLADGRGAGRTSGGDGATLGRRRLRRSHRRRRDPHGRRSRMGVCLLFVVCGS